MGGGQGSCGEKCLSEDCQGREEPSAARRVGVAGTQKGMGGPDGRAEKRRKHAESMVQPPIMMQQDGQQPKAIPNSEITLNGGDLVSAAQTEKEGLITELKETLDTMSRQSQLERKQAEAEALQSQFTKMPMKIYIG